MSFLPCTISSDIFYYKFNGFKFLSINDVVIKYNYFQYTIPLDSFSLFDRCDTFLCLYELHILLEGIPLDTWNSQHYQCEKSLFHCAKKDF